MKQIFINAQKLYKFWYAQFSETNNRTTEFYNRGRLEGMAKALYPLWLESSAEEREALDSQFNDYVLMWGEPDGSEVDK